MSKTYKTSEAIAMLEHNPNLRFKTEYGKDLYSLTTEDKEYTYFYFERDGVEVPFNGYVKAEDRWQLVQQPVPFIEAVKAYAEGKTIRCVQEHGTTNYFRGGDEFSQFMDENHCFPCYDRIINSKWYICHD